MKRVDAASRPASARVRCSGSTFETNATSGAPLRASSWAASASHARRGPRSEPPMPILMTERSGRPVAPLRRPSRTARVISDIRSRVARISAVTSTPSTTMLADECARSAGCSAGRRSDRLTFSPANSAAIQCARFSLLGRLQQGAERLGVDPLLREVNAPVVPLDGQRPHALGIADEKLVQRRRLQPARMVGKVGERGGGFDVHDCRFDLRDSSFTHGRLEWQC